MGEGKTQPEKLLLDIDAVSSLTELSRRTIYRLMSRNEFPKPKHIPGGRSVRWTRGSVQKWCERLPDAENYACE